MGTMSKSRAIDIVFDSKERQIRFDGVALETLEDLTGVSIVEMTTDASVMKKMTGFSFVVKALYCGMMHHEGSDGNIEFDRAYVGKNMDTTKILHYQKLIVKGIVLALRGAEGSDEYLKVIEDKYQKNVGAGAQGDVPTKGEETTETQVSTTQQIGLVSSTQPLQ